VGLRWDWLGPSVTVPFVPTIGPVHPNAVGPGLFSDVISVAGTDMFLAYDKDRRWLDVKTEGVLVDGIVHDRHETWFPVPSRRSVRSVTVYVYGGFPDDQHTAWQLASKLGSAHGAATASVVWFVGINGSPPPSAQITSVQLQEFLSERKASVPETVLRLDECAGAIEATFVSFVHALAEESFAFLHSRMARGAVGPVLVAVEEGRIVGAIGPMEIMRDSTGSARLLPQYFGVLPGRRGRGHGRALWRAAMQWGERNGAAYQVIQTEVGGASEHICRTEGLRSLGLISRMTAHT
jgi:GNAT superfamily N-acetyltransferase